jgi:hypothetical protein
LAYLKNVEQKDDNNNNMEASLQSTRGIDRHQHTMEYGAKTDATRQKISMRLKRALTATGS